MSSELDTSDARIQDLLEELERADDQEATSRARSLVDAVLDWHHGALSRLLEIARGRGAEGRAIVEALGKDPLVGSMLALHELQPLPPTNSEFLLAAERLVLGGNRSRAPRPPEDAPDVMDTCEMCGAILEGGHEHLFEPTARTLRCGCPVCVRVESSRARSAWKRVPRRAELLRDVQWSDIEWARLGIPIGLAFFQRSSVADKTVAFYPSPAGAVESKLLTDVWYDLLRTNPIFGEMEPDVEALLVHRRGTARDHYRVSIDRAYFLVGLIRREWRGLQGGDTAWREVTAFFQRLNAGGGMDG